MDSKLRRTVILWSLAIGAIIILGVLLLNSGDQAGTKQKPSTEESEVQKQETPVASAVNGQIGNDLQGFLTDPHFFDEEKNHFLEQMLSGKQLSLLITSIQKDLRIQILDDLGKLVSGESFLLRLNDKDTYKDLDQDGVVYIADLSPGEYQVKLMPMEGFQVPVTATRVKVKERVEYVAIDDISLLIKTEDEVDAMAEDTAVAEAVSDADKTEIKRFQATSTDARLGIDVSKWNKEIDWDRVKNAGIEYAIIRAGYRGSVSGSLVEDPYFAANVRGAKAAGLPFGIYFFTQATNEVEAVEEASMVISLLGQEKPQYPVFIDTEGAGGNGRADGLDVETRTLVCEAFCRTLENAGFKAGVYASRNWYNQCLDTKRLDRYVIWLAEYRSQPLYQGYYQLWQYTSQGKVDGIEGNVDLNISYYKE